jgi:hypothetical protein
MITLNRELTDIVMIQVIQNMYYKDDTCNVVVSNKTYTIKPELYESINQCAVRLSNLVVNDIMSICVNWLIFQKSDLEIFEAD